MKNKRFVILNDKLSNESNRLYYNINTKACHNDIRLATVFDSERNASIITSYKDQGCFNYEVVDYDKEVEKYKLNTNSPKIF